MASNAIISVICAVRNEERFIRETLDSVVSQSYPNWELVLMDGGSTDGTLEILKDYAAKYKNIIVRSEPDEGQWHALDKGLSLARGEYLFILCGQDGYLDNDWFKQCVQVFQKHPEVSLVWGIPFVRATAGELLGPHYAYAGFLKDERYGSRIKFIRTMNFFPASRLWRKLSWPRITTLLRNFRKQEVPQKKDWFFYWLRTGLAFPDGNMCVRKDVFLRHTKRFSEEKRTNAVLLDFSFNFNANGYLAYGLPVPANFGRYHKEGQDLRNYDDLLAKEYFQRIYDFRKKMIHDY